MQARMNRFFETSITMTMIYFYNNYCVWIDKDIHISFKLKNQAENEKNNEGEKEI